MGLPHYTIIWLTTGAEKRNKKKNQILRMDSLQKYNIFYVLCGETYRLAALFELHNVG